MTVTITSVSGSELAPYLSDLARLRIGVFREYPYLYDGSQEYEERYLQAYITSPDSMAVLALDDGGVIGASTGIPMADETDAFRQPFEHSGIDTKSLFYCGESVLLSAYRGRGIYHYFFTGREQYARDKGFKTICFCAVVRPADHPARPANYMHLDGIWRRFGYAPHPELNTTLAWKELGHNQESIHPMVFWIKRLEEI